MTLCCHLFALQVMAPRLAYLFTEAASAAVLPSRNGMRLSPACQV